MSTFHGKQSKGAMRVIRELKRTEAEQRQKGSVHTNSKAHRLGRCDCDDV